MLSHKVFTEGMNKLAIVFPGITNLARVQRYYAAVGTLSDEAFEQIIDDLLDSARSMPLPKDFAEAARAWKSNYFKTHGSYYAETSKPDEPTNDCALCNDLGYVKITHHDPDSKFQTLMRCHCEKGRGGSIGIPEWDNTLRSAYKREPCPIEWFKPEQISEFSSDAAILGQLMNKITRWKDILRSAEEYWNNVRSSRKKN